MGLGLGLGLGVRVRVRVRGLGLGLVGLVSLILLLTKPRTFPMGFRHTVILWSCQQLLVLLAAGAESESKTSWWMTALTLDLR